MQKTENTLRQIGFRHFIKDLEQRLNDPNQRQDALQEFSFYCQKQPWVINFAGKDLSPLTIAAGNGDLQVVKLLLKNGANPNHHYVDAEFSDCHTPLTAAALNGNLEIVQLLLQSGAEINTLKSTLNPANALTYAANAGNSDLIQLLLINGATPQIELWNKGHTNLKYAIKSKNLESVKLLFATTNIDEIDNQDTQFLQAVVQGGLEMFEFFSAQGLQDPNMEYLHLTAAFGDLELFNHLLNKGYDPDQKTFIYSYFNNNSEILSLLLERGFDFAQLDKDKSDNKDFVFAKAANSGNILAAYNLLQIGAKVNSVIDTSKFNLVEDKLILDQNNFELEETTPLIEAVRADKEEMVNFLINNSANLNLEVDCYDGNFFFCTDALRIAVIEGKNHFIQPLLDAGASDKSKNSSLRDAIKTQNLAAAEILLQNDALIHNDLLFFAVESGNPEMINFLLQKGCVIDETNGLNLVLTAAKTGKPEVFKLLFEMQKDFVLESEYAIMEIEKTAIQNSDIELINFLVEMGFDFKTPNLFFNPSIEHQIDYSTFIASNASVETIRAYKTDIPLEIYCDAIIKDNPSEVPEYYYDGRINRMGDDDCVNLKTAIEIKNSVINYYLTNNNGAMAAQAAKEAKAALATYIACVYDVRDCILTSSNLEDSAFYNQRLCRLQEWFDNFENPNKHQVLGDILKDPEYLSRTWSLKNMSESATQNSISKVLESNDLSGFISENLIGDELTKNIRQFRDGSNINLNKPIIPKKAIKLVPEKSQETMV